jgi:plasmid stabilization system protein ParE
MTPEFLAEARAEVESAFAYYRNVSPDLGTRFVDDLERVLDRIVASPRLPAPMAGGFRSRFMTSFPYQVVYRIEHDTIRIYAVAHFKRRTAYWRRRVPP